MKIRHVNWYPHGWLSGTYELSLDERGAYVTIVLMIYARVGPITQTADWPPQFKCHGHTLNRIIKRLQTLGKITANGQQISVNRCASELQRAVKRLEKAPENGSKPKRNKDLGEAGASAVSSPEPETKQITKNKEQDSDSPSSFPPEGDQPQEKQDGDDAVDSFKLIGTLVKQASGLLSNAASRSTRSTRNSSNSEIIISAEEAECSTGSRAWRTCAARAIESAE